MINAQSAGGQENTPNVPKPLSKTPPRNERHEYNKETIW